MKPQTRILPPEQQAIWRQLSPAKEMGFVLYGGTAIALRFGHRTSVDFDFFSSQPVSHESLWKAFDFMGKAQILHQESNSSQSTLVVLSSGGVKVSFFSGISFGRYGEVEETDDGVMLIASPDDLLATKLKAVLQRSEAKDYVDIYTLLRNGCDLAHGLALAEDMFKPQLSPAIVLKALVYFGDGDLANLPNDVTETLRGAVSSVKTLPSPQKISDSLAKANAAQAQEDGLSA